MNAADDSNAFSGFRLLEVPNASVSTGSSFDNSGNGLRGDLFVDSVTIPITHSEEIRREYEEKLEDAGRDAHGDEVYLILRLGTFEAPILPLQVVEHTSTEDTHKFVFRDFDGLGGVQFTVTLSAARGQDDVETFAGILSQYCDFRSGWSTTDSPRPASSAQESFPAPLPVISSSDKAPAQETLTQENPAHIYDPPPSLNITSPDGRDLRNTLVLVDPSTGNVLDTLGRSDKVKIQEDRAIAGQAAGPSGAGSSLPVPVIVDVPETDEQGEWAKGEIYVHPAYNVKNDILMRGATLLSRGIILLTDGLTSGMRSASSYYVSRSAPTTQPVEISDRTRSYASGARSVSGQVVKVTHGTVKTIDKYILRAMDRVAGKKTQPAPGNNGGVNGPYPPYPPYTSCAAQSPASVPLPPSGPGTPVPPPLPPRKSYLQAGTPSSSTPQPMLRSPSPAPSTAPPPYQARPPPGSTIPPSATAPPPPSSPPKKLIARLFLSADLVMTTVDNSLKQLVHHGNDSVGRVVGHKYGAQAQGLSRDVGGVLQNAVLVYIDAQNVGHRALMRKVGKGYVKAKYVNKNGGPSKA